MKDACNGVDNILLVGDIFECSVEVLFYYVNTINIVRVIKFIQFKDRLVDAIKLYDTVANEKVAYVAAAPVNWYAL